MVVVDAQENILARKIGQYVIDTNTAISSIGVDNNSNNTWYNLQGQKLSGKPAAPGIYINGGKKVIIK